MGPRPLKHLDAIYHGLNVSDGSRALAVDGLFSLLVYSLISTVKGPSCPYVNLNLVS